MKQPLVTISIPTYNSEPFLALCLESIKTQTYPNIEINIVDGKSKDRTIEITKEYGVENILINKVALLGARHEGLKIANGELILLLDSDQILAPDAIERAVKFIEAENKDMLILEEGVYQAKNWLEKLFELDRRLVHHVKDFDPFTSVMLPRFYRKKVLDKAFANIPGHVMAKTGGQDHAIIYYEAWKITQKIGLLPHAVRHIEPNSLTVMIKKFYRWGRTSVNAHHGHYAALLKRKERFRKGLFTKGMFAASIASIILLVIKGVPYIAGYVVGRIKRA
jgi:glycosyltransferase involved in cell wall biosynthesis